MPTLTPTLETQTVLGPLTPEWRVAIMREARSMDRGTRRTFRRLLVLAQPRGLTAEVIARTAVQAQEHAPST